MHADRYTEIHRKRGFTLLEVLLATSLIAMAMSLLFASFSNVARASQKGQAKLDRLRHGELVMDQLVRALRFAVFFENNPRKFAFWHERNTGHPPQDVISWVTSSPAFISPRDPLVNGLHRIFLSIESRDGSPALHAVAYPHLQDMDDPEFEEKEPWVVSREVIGLEFRWYDQDGNAWENEWENENALPQFVEVTLTLRPVHPGEKAAGMTRVVQIPAGAFSRLRNRLIQPADPGVGAEAESPGSPGRAGGNAPPGRDGSAPPPGIHTRGQPNAQWNNNSAPRGDPRSNNTSGGNRR